MYSLYVNVNYICSLNKLPLKGHFGWQIVCEGFAVTRKKRCLDLGFGRALLSMVHHPAAQGFIDVQCEQRAQFIGCAVDKSIIKGAHGS